MMGDGSESEGEEDEHEGPLISLHALTGVVDGKTMRIKSYIGNKRVNILMDTGSTHNFLDETIAQDWEGQVETVPSMG